MHISRTTTVLCECRLEAQHEVGGSQVSCLIHLRDNANHISHALDTGSLRWLSQKSTMLVGIDVTHPGPGSVKFTPSIAAVVASTNETYAQYPASMRLQESKKEVLHIPLSLSLAHDGIIDGY